MHRLALIQREDMLAAADQLDRLEKVQRADYFLLLTKRGKEYPFEQALRRAYEVATKTTTDGTFFQSNPTIRTYIYQKLGYLFFFGWKRTFRFSQRKKLNILQMTIL